MVLSLWLRVPPPPVNCPAADRRRRETMCLKGQSSFFTFQFCRPHFGNFFGRENTVAKIPVQARHDVRHFEPARFFRHSGQKAREWFPAFGYLHRLAFRKPRSHARKTVSQISDGGCFHRDTNVYHRVERVKPARLVQPARNAKTISTDFPPPVSSPVSYSSIPWRRGLARCG